MTHESTMSLQERDATIEEIAGRVGVRAERGRRFAELTSLHPGHGRRRAVDERGRVRA
ncbi:MAG: hypothetical protein LC747_06735 [Acidobacteria bacterium]|nr:hypothetical protein [Acidobacteriota bacterium]